jgi:hypothetical protein
MPLEADGRLAPGDSGPQRLLKAVGNGLVRREAAEQLYRVAIKPDPLVN